MTENQFRSHFSPFQINVQLQIFFKIGSQNGCRRPFWMTENHFRSHLFGDVFFHKMAAAAIWMTENHFRSHFSPFQINTQQNGCRRPFWMNENHFLSHFLPFQINTQLLFLCSQNGCRWPFLMTENYFRSHFSPFQINTQLFIFFTKWPPPAILEVRFAPKTIGFFHYVLSLAMSNMKLIGEFYLWHR